MADTRSNFFLTFRDPIRRTIAVIPAKLEQATKGNIGSLSWEIEQSVRQAGGSDLAARVGRLSRPGIQALINTPLYGSGGLHGAYTGNKGERGYILPPPDRLNGFRELEAAHLLRFQEPLDPWLRFIESLPMREDLSVPVPWGRTMILTSPLTPEQERRIHAQYYELTPKGVQAVEAIVNAIGEQLQAK